MGKTPIRILDRWIDEKGEARQYVDTILAHLQTHSLDRTEEVLQVYLTCQSVLDAEQDPRVQDLLQMAFTQLRARATTLETEAQRRQFWSVPAHRTVQVRDGGASLAQEYPRAVPGTGQQRSGLRNGL